MSKYLLEISYHTGEDRNDKQSRESEDNFGGDIFVFDEEINMIKYYNRIMKITNNKVQMYKKELKVKKRIIIKNYKKYNNCKSYIYVWI